MHTRVTVITRNTACVATPSGGQTHVIAEVYHPRPFCCFSMAYDLGAELQRHIVPDSEVPLSRGRCRRSDAPHVGQRVVPGPDLHYVAVMQAQTALHTLSAALSASPAPRARRTCTWLPHLSGRTCTWPPAPAHGRAPLLHTTCHPEPTRRIHRTGSAAAI